MKHKEILRKGMNHDDSEIGDFLLRNCDNNYNFKRSYEIVWEVKMITHKTNKEKK